MQDRLQSGLMRLEQANNQVSEIQSELQLTRPELEKAEQETNTVVTAITEENLRAQKQQVLLNEEQAQARVQEQAALLLKAEAET